MNSSAISRAFPFCGVFLLLLLVLGAQEAKSSPIKIGDLLGDIGILALEKIVKNAYVEDDIDLLGHPCQYKRIPYIKKWEVHYKAEVRCLGWTSIVGQERDRKNPTHAEQGAIKDFVRKVLEKGLITADEAKEWI